MGLAEIGSIVGGIGGLVGGAKSDKGMEAMAAAMQRQMNISPYSKMTGGQKKQALGAQFQPLNENPSDVGNRVTQASLASIRPWVMQNSANAFQGGLIDRFSGGAQSGDSGIAKRLATQWMDRTFDPASAVALNAQNAAIDRRLGQANMISNSASNFGAQTARAAGDAAQAHAMSGVGLANAIGGIGRMMTDYGLSQQQQASQDAMLKAYQARTEQWA